MSDSTVSIKLDSNETFLLLSLMGFDELIGFSHPFLHSTEEEIQNALGKAEQQLLKNGFLYMENGEIGIDPMVYLILQACKQSPRISWLNIVKDEKVFDYYYYLSSQQVIELTKEHRNGQDTVEFKLLGNIYRYYDELLGKIDIPFDGSPFQSKQSISFHTHQYLVNHLHLSSEELESYLLREGASADFAQALVQGFKQNTAIGQLVYFSKAAERWERKGLKFLIEHNGNWLFTQKQENGYDAFQVKCFNRDDFYRSFLDEALIASK